MKPLLTRTSILNGFSYGFVCYTVYCWAFVARQPSKFDYFTRVFFLSTFFCSCGGQNRVVKSPCVHRTEHHYLNQCMQTSLRLKLEDKTHLYLWLQDRSLFDPETPPRIRSVTKLSQNISLKSTLCNLNTLRPIPDFIRLLNQNCQRSRTNSIEDIFL